MFGVCRDSSKGNRLDTSRTVTTLSLVPIPMRFPCEVTFGCLAKRAGNLQTRENKLVTGDSSGVSSSGAILETDSNELLTELTDSVGLPKLNSSHCLRTRQKLKVIMFN